MNALKKTLAATAVAAGLTGCQTAGPDPSLVADATREEVTRVEPLSWWTGMKTPLQLMVQGKDIGRKKITVAGGKGVMVKHLHKAANPDYLFVDIEVDENAKPGTYYLFISDGKQMVKYPYLIREREKGSADRKSFTTEDLIYLIMPDRFASARSGNDSKWDGEAYDDGSAIPWDVPETPDAVDRNDPVARHGGDIQGIIDHLDYVADLGATALWSTPLLLDNQPAESYHGYACSDYYHIDPRLGDNALYRKMVDTAHEKGLKVIMDVVTNHCGTAHWWMENPPFPDWYHVSEPYMQMNALFSVYMDPHASIKDRERQESGWFVPSMPDMNLDNPYVLRYFQQWAVWWIEYAGLDGLRVDTYPYNEPEAMAEWCKAVRKEYPGINIVGECWDMNIPQVAYWQSGNPNKNGFDSHLPSIMDFPLQQAIVRAGLFRPGAGFRLPRPGPDDDLLRESRPRPHGRRVPARSGADETRAGASRDAPRHPATLLRRRDDVLRASRTASRRVQAHRLPGRLAWRSGEPLHGRRPRRGRLHPGCGLYDSRRPARLRPRSLPLAPGLLRHPPRQDAAFPLPEKRRGRESYGQHVCLLPL